MMSSGPTSLLKVFNILLIPPLILRNGRDANRVHLYELMIFPSLSHFRALENVDTAINVPGSIPLSVEMLPVLRLRNIPYLYLHAAYP